MEKHRCKLCSRTFKNGRALGGHMKSHLAPSPTTRKKLGQLQSESASSSSGNRDEKSLVYGLRENPKRSFRTADPEISFANLDSGSSVFVVVQEDGESETDSKNAGQRKSKRIRDSGWEMMKQKAKKTPSKAEWTTESPEPVSSVSDTSPEEDVAMCLMILSRDVWKREIKEVKVTKIRDETLEEAEFKPSLCSDFQCGKCKKVFKSNVTLIKHKRSCLDKFDGNEMDGMIFFFKCPFCDKVFLSDEALGGHKRSHSIINSSTMIKKKHLIDLNLPATLDDDDDDDSPSLVSDT